MISRLVHEFYLILFKSLETKEGHFLWPRFGRSGDGFFLLKIPSNRPNSTPQPHQEATMAIFQQILNTSYLELLDEHHVMPLANYDYHDDVKILDAFEKLISSDCPYILNVNPPENMTYQEKIFYKRHKF